MQVDEQVALRPVHEAQRPRIPPPRSRSWALGHNPLNRVHMQKASATDARWQRRDGLGVNEHLLHPLVAVQAWLRALIQCSGQVLGLGPHEIQPPLLLLEGEGGATIASRTIEDHEGGTGHTLV